MTNPILDKINSIAQFEAAQFCSINFRTIESLDSYIDDFLQNPDIISHKKSFVFNKAMLHLVKESHFGIEKISHIPYRDWLVLSNQIERYKEIQIIDVGHTNPEGFLSSVVNKATTLGLDKSYLLQTVEGNLNSFKDSDIESFYKKFALKMGSMELETLGELKVKEIISKTWPNINQVQSKFGTPLIYHLSNTEADYKYIDFLIREMKASFWPLDNASPQKNPIFFLRTAAMLDLALKEEGLDINFQTTNNNILSCACSYYENKIQAPNMRQQFIDFIGALYERGFNFDMQCDIKDYDKELESGLAQEVTKKAPIVDVVIKKQCSKCYSVLIEALPILKQKIDLESKIVAQRQNLSVATNVYKV